MKKKVLALFLCCALVFGLVPAALSTAFSSSSDFTIYGSNGAPTDSVTLPQNDKTTLTAVAETGSGRYQWQIRVSDSVWANIVGSTGTTLELSYAMVANLLSGDTVDVRCRLTNGVNNITYSNIVAVTVAAETQNAAAKSAPAFGTVISGAEPIGEPIISGTPDDAAAPASAPTPAADPAPIAEADPAVEGEVGIAAASLTEEGTPADGDTGNGEDNGGSTNEEPPAPSTYSIVINYIFENGNTAAPSWTATVATGTTYQQTIKSPVVLGYTPDQEAVSVDASGEMTYTVTYSAAQVNYKVKHWQQNVSNDEYTQVDTETKTGYTEAAVGEGLAKTYSGFYSLLYDTTTKIAADGSTEVNVYYDRYYYLMSFNLDGGYGVEPIYARYGAPISIGTPEKPGYSFNGWDKNLPATMPAENRSYTAQWEAGDGAKVTIVVWGENADNEEYSFYHNSEIIAKPGEKLTLDDLQGKLICGKEEHTHSSACGINCSHAHDAACYGGMKQENPVDGKTGSANENIAQFKSLTGGALQNGKVYRVKCNGATTTTGYDKYYLYYNNTWYLVSAENISGSALATSKKVNAHSHSWNLDNRKDQFWVYNSKLSCTHTHDDSCYACGKEPHTHTSACYYNTSYMENPNLWKLVRSDEITVAADGTSIINVYYDRVEFTLHFRKANSNSDNYGTIKAKWGANIREQFNAKCTQAGTSNWSEKSNADSPWTSFLDIMPEKDMTFYANTDGYGTSTAYYYVEGLDGKDELYYTNVSTGSGYTVTVEEFINIDGFTFNADRSAKVGNDFDGAKFYYTRNSYTLKFFNRTEELTDKAKTVKYEAPLKNYNFEPAYPSDLEPNAYVFAGWYTTAGCYEGSEADLSTMTMPASDVILYAKWTAKTHTVKTYLTKDAMDSGNAPLNTWSKVPHGTAVTNPPDEPENGKYTFVGWFYISDAGEEKAFDFSMPVNRDLNLYAKWSSNTLMTYTIRYQLADGTEIATPTKGSALAGTTRTFDAKTGTQLYDDYQSGYFPQTSSHSLTIDIEGTAENGKNEFIFVYVPKAEVNYTVRYLEKDTNTVLHDEKQAATRDAVITEKFVQINGYAPDAYQKRLVLSADEEQNVITFWYVKDNDHAPVQIIHWTQNIEGDGYTEYSSSTDLNGIIGTMYTETPLELRGFQYNGTKSNASGTLSAEGLVLNLYYDRIEYPYEFRFLEQGTEKKLAEPATGSARYMAQVTQAAKTIPGYKLVSGIPDNQDVRIAIEDPANVASKNVKTFYYVEDTVNIKYEMVGPTGSGTLDNYQDNGIGVLTGKIANTEDSLKGSAPTAADGFKFVGWFKDAACEEPVDETWVVNNKLTPDKTKNYGTDTNPAMGYEAATYYAKFEYDVADLTITKQGCENIDENQSFLFDVTGPNGYSTRVVINGNGSVIIKGLKIGEYTVTEVTSWSWRYDAKSSSQSIKLQPAQTNAVNFVNSRSNHKWLGGDAYSNNVFGSIFNQ